MCQAWSCMMQGFDLSWKWNKIKQLLLSFVRIPLLVVRISAGNKHYFHEYSFLPSGSPRHPQNNGVITWKRVAIPTYQVARYQSRLCNYLVGYRYYRALALVITLAINITVFKYGWALWLAIRQIEMMISLSYLINNLDIFGHCLNVDTHVSEYLFQLVPINRYVSMWKWICFSNVAFSPVVQ